VDILLLGGYVFLGRALIEAAQARGHRVTAFNRGNRPVMPNVEQLTGDRNAPAFPADRNWDVVIDTSGQAPAQLRSAAEALRDRVTHYTFTSSISVYASPMLPSADETAPLATFAHGADPDNVRDLDNYGARKAACEAALTELMQDRTLLIRPGFIVGPYDYSDRFNSWVERGPESQPFLVPIDPDAPCQLIDVRDLAAWMIELAERRTTGTYNATGPKRLLRAVDVARTCIAATGGSAEPLVVSSEKLHAAGVVPWQHLPFWLEPEDYPLMQVDVRRAIGAGLRFRSLSDTVRDTYEWLRSSAHERRIAVPPDVEARLRASLQ
jgi:2'-hydroxyisoflavone reductase